MITVRSLQKRDAKAWRALWAGYNAFYRAKIGSRVTDRTWARLLNKRGRMLGRVAEENGVVVGFAHAVIHDGTWTANPICYLEDLYVAPAARSRGVATALIEDLIRLGRAKKWDRLYWHTQASNATARRLYDRFVTADDFVRYRLPLKPS